MRFWQWHRCLGMHRKWREEIHQQGFCQNKLRGDGGAVETMQPRQMAVNGGDTSSVVGEDGGAVVCMKKATKKRRRMKSKFARNLKKRSNQKDSSTWRNFDDAMTAGFIAPTCDATMQVTSQAAARKINNSQLIKALVQCNNEKTLE
ncbi:hypothetical protein ACHAW6_000455 [Cyclotella cf. meneghiniana]